MGPAQTRPERTTAPIFNDDSTFRQSSGYAEISSLTPEQKRAWIVNIVEGFSKREGKHTFTLHEIMKLWRVSNLPAISGGEIELRQLILENDDYLVRTSDDRGNELYALKPPAYDTIAGKLESVHLNVRDEIAPLTLRNLETLIKTKANEGVTISQFQFEYEKRFKKILDFGSFEPNEFFRGLPEVFKVSEEFGQIILTPRSKSAGIESTRLPSAPGSCEKSILKTPKDPIRATIPSAVTLTAPSREKPEKASTGKQQAVPSKNTGTQQGTKQKKQSKGESRQPGTNPAAARSNSRQRTSETKQNSESNRHRNQKVQSNVSSSSAEAIPQLYFQLLSKTIQSYDGKGVSVDYFKERFVRENNIPFQTFGRSEKDFFLSLSSILRVNDTKNPKRLFPLQKNPLARQTNASMSCSALRDSSQKDHPKCVSTVNLSQIGARQPRPNDRTHWVKGAPPPIQGVTPFNFPPPHIFPPPFPMGASAPTTSKKVHETSPSIVPDDHVRCSLQILKNGAKLWVVSLGRYHFIPVGSLAVLIGRNEDEISKNLNAKGLLPAHSRILNNPTVSKALIESGVSRTIDVLLLPILNVTDIIRIMQGRETNENLIAEIESFAREYIRTNRRDFK